MVDAAHHYEILIDLVQSERIFFPADRSAPESIQVFPLADAVVIDSVEHDEATGYRPF